MCYGEYSTPVCPVETPDSATPSQPHSPESVFPPTGAQFYLYHKSMLLLLHQTSGDSSTCYRRCKIGSRLKCGADFQRFPNPQIVVSPFLMVVTYLGQERWCYLAPKPAQLRSLSHLALLLIRFLPLVQVVPSVGMPTCNSDHRLQ